MPATIPRKIATAGCQGIRTPAAVEAERHGYMCVLLAGKLLPGTNNGELDWIEQILSNDS